jgi:alkanesulfonate monooxygenase SsuD/methylene tetrahydromethanopterin reductase-like flavin-dependent oxidoreductase (luciferase family)
MTRLRVGVMILPEERWAEARGRWEAAERLGFAHAWTYDHLTWRGFRDTAWFGAIPTLTAAAVATRRIRLGTLVASINFRHPLTLAKEVVALDDISGGRFTLGIGAGGSGWDATMLGQAWPARERADRFEEFVTLTDRLLRAPKASFDGRYYAVDEARTFPGCVQHPRVPFAVAASGSRGMRLAARYAQTWVTTGVRTKQAPIGAVEGAEDVRRQMVRLDRACHEIGRDPASLRRLVVTGPEAGGPVLDSGLASVDAFQETVGRYAAVGVTDLVVHWPRPDGPFAGDLDTFERICSSVLDAAAHEP